MSKNFYSTRQQKQTLHRFIASILCFFLSFLPTTSWPVTAATSDLSCAGNRLGQVLNCNAGDFTVAPIFSAETGTSPFCMIGSTFDINIELSLSDSNTDRQDIGFFVGQQGNDPGLTTAGNICSVATFANGPFPFEDNDGDSCGDFHGGGVATELVTSVRVDCIASPTGFLQIPYLLSYWQNNGNVCTGPNDVEPASKSKCNKGIGEVSGAVAISAGAWLDITKETTPDGDPQVFTYTASGPPGSTVIALTGATLTPTSATGGTYSPATTALASETTTFTLSDGQTARVFINALSSDQTLTVTETLATGWDPVAAITCAPTGGSPTIASDNASRQMSATLNTSNYAGSCTITNTKRPSVTITKVSNGDVGTFNFTGTNTWISQNITTLAAGTGVDGTTQYLPYSTATQITETATTGYRLDNIVCTGISAGGVATTNIANRTVDFDTLAMAPGADINCTFTNIRQRNLTVNKSLTPTTDTGLFVMNANGSTSTEGGHNTSITTLVDVGANVLFSEAAGTNTNFINYDSSYNCNTSPTTTGTATSGSLTMPNADIACTFSNTRKSAALTLRKVWTNAINGDSVTVNASGFVNNASSGTSVSTGDNTTIGSAVTVYSGESGTISETFNTGNTINYNSNIACTGTSGLSINTLTIGPTDSNITCTYTNSRKSTSLSLAKTWVNAYTMGDTASVNSSGFINNATSGNSVTTGNNTTTGAAVTVYAAETGTLTESFSIGNAANYNASVACSGTSGLSGNSLTISPTDTNIVCTYTNIGIKALLNINKSITTTSDPINPTNAKAIAGATVSYTIRVTNTGIGTVDDNSIVITDLLPENISLFVNDIAGPGSGPIAFTDGAISSGLTWNFISLSDLTDSIEFSNDNGATWSYTPTPNADGFDSSITDIRLLPIGIMNASSASGSPYFELSIQAQIQ